MVEISSLSPDWTRTEAGIGHKLSEVRDWDGFIDKPFLATDVLPTLPHVCREGQFDVMNLVLFQQTGPDPEEVVTTPLYFAVSTDISATRFNLTDLSAAL